MSEKTPHRRPATFKLDDPGVIVMDPGRFKPPCPRHGPCHAGSRPVAAAGPDRCAAGPGAARLSLGHAVLGRRRRAGAARARARHRQSDRGSVCAQRKPRLPRAGLRDCRRAGADGRDRARSVRAGAARDHRETASARRRGAAQRRPRGEPGHRRRPAQAGAPEPAAGACPRRAGKPCRRHHRRRRHDQARRARIDDAARSGGAPAGLVGRAARFDRHSGEPARADRRAVRVRGLVADDPATGAALWRTAGHASA